MGKDLTQNTLNTLTYGPQGSADRMYRRANQMIHGERNPAEVAAILDELEKLARPATEAEIAQHLAVLLASVPSAVKDEAFVRILAEDVRESQPSLGVLELGCRTLRRSRTSSFPPTINETLKALDEAASERRQIFAKLSDHKRKLRLECFAGEMLPPDNSRSF